MKNYNIQPYNYALEDDLLIFSDTQLDLKLQDLIDQNLDLDIQSQASIGEASQQFESPPSNIYTQRRRAAFLGALTLASSIFLITKYDNISQAEVIPKVEYIQQVEPLNPLRDRPNNFSFDLDKLQEPAKSDEVINPINPADQINQMPQIDTIEASVLNEDTSDTFLIIDSQDYLQEVNPIQERINRLQAPEGYTGYKADGSRHSLDIFIAEEDKNFLMEQAGIASKHWPYVDAIVSRESTWRPFVWNQQGSSAFGLCQSMKSLYEDSWADDFMTNPISQLKWCHNYALNRYGSWQKAYEFWQKNHWW